MEKVRSITLEDLTAYDGNQRKEYKTVLETHVNMLKDPVAVERGCRDGEKHRKQTETSGIKKHVQQAL